ncbi:peptidoglycan-binding protein [Nonomuraea sp. NBC_01738]|uniref:peptidoglycan-binding protein n=1 Tax=Nonomuraea sp. NBC_01738 TaxID=2976003 RepID=UPI002E14C1DE|nr:peptidoglycan-binding protein [Nonomuraea sp. NBC_01738]
MTIAIAGGTGLALVGGSEQPPPARPPGANAAVEKTTLREHKTITGALGYAGRTEVAAVSAGQLTWRPPAGRIIRLGQRLYQCDGVDVVLLYGKQPAWRQLKNGTEGPDVRQLESSLARLGFTGFTVDDTYSKATADAVRRWQKQRGIKQSGVVDPASIWFAPEPVRVLARKSGLGQPLTAGTPVLSVTSLRRVVTLQVKIDERELVNKGVAVTVTLPGGTKAKGRISAIGTTVSNSGADQGQDGQKIKVTVTLTGRLPADMYDSGPAEVSLVSGQKKGVLAVPISALLAMPGGGYGVMLVQADGTGRTIKVKTGMFAGGKVEVTSADLSAGDRVEVPS